MGSIRTVESIAKLVKTSVTTLSLPASRLNIGAAQFVTSTLTLNTAVTGVGGLDAGTIAAGQIYTVYAVVSSNVVYLVASLSSSLPSGFTAARQVGGFSTDLSSQIDQVAYQAGDLSVLGTGSFLSGVLAPPVQNFIINGGFDFWQRGTTGALTSYQAGTYVSADRWKGAALMQTVGGGGVSFVKDTSAPTNNSSASLKVNLTDTRVDVCTLGQYIESSNCTTLVGKTCTISFWVKRISSSLNAYPMTAYINYLNTKDTVSNSMADGALTTQIASTVIISDIRNLSTSFTKYSMTFVVPSGGINGLYFRINVGNSIGDIASATGDLLSIGEVMLNIGTSAAPFQRAGGTIGGELQLCQRYYEAGGVVYTGYDSNSFPGENHHFPISFKVEKRAVPAMSYGTPTWAAGWSASKTLVDYNVQTISAAPYTTIDNANQHFCSFGWAASAEL